MRCVIPRNGGWREEMTGPGGNPAGYTTAAGGCRWWWLMPATARAPPSGLQLEPAVAVIAVKGTTSAHYAYGGMGRPSVPR